MAELVQLQPFPSYSSVVRYYGRSILPPLPFHINPEEIQKIKNKARLVEAQIQLRKALKLEMAQEMEKLKANKELSPDNKQGGNANGCENGPLDVQFNVSIHSSSSLEEIQEEEEVASSNRNIINANHFDACDGRHAPKMTNSISNPLLETAQAFQENLERSESRNLLMYPESRSGLDYRVTTPILVRPECILRGPSPAPSDVSDNAKLSEMEFPSLDTVIMNNGYSNSIDSDSVAQSTDLDKYMDGSAEDSQLSEPSTIVDDIQEVEQAIQNRHLSRDDVPFLSQLLASRSDGSGNVMVQSESAISDSRPTNDVHQSNKSNIPESLHLSLHLTKDDMNEKHKTQVNHNRSNSYTLDVPSPILLKSHTDCMCMQSPTTSAIPPHCTSILSNEFEEKSDTSPELENIRSQLFATEHEKISGNDQIKTSPNDQTIAQTGATSPPDNSLSSNTSDVSRPASKHKLVNDLYETFKEMHQMKVQVMLQQHQEQWKKLEEEFQEQESVLRSQIDAIIIIDSNDDAASEHSTVPIPTEVVYHGKDSIDPASEIPLTENLLEPPKLFTNVEDANEDHLSKTESELTLVSSPSTLTCNETSVPPTDDATGISAQAASAEVSLERSLKEKEHLMSVLKALNDPEMNRKFAKVSATVKGYLTRRLIRTPRLQKVLQNIQEAAYQIYTSTGREQMSDTEIKVYKIWSKQFKQSCKELWHIFFGMSTKERMKIISDSRKASNSKSSSKLPIATYPLSSGVKLFKKCQLSSATVKRLERKSSKSQESLQIRSRHPQNRNILSKKSPTGNIVPSRRSRSQSAHCFTVASSKQNGSPLSCTTKRRLPLTKDGIY